MTNPKKIFWPDDKLTKKDLVEYYERISPALLPYLYARPVVLVRYPDGIAGKSFYQWNVPVSTPSWVKTLAIRRDEDEGREVTCFLVNDVETLLYIANFGCIPIHILAARSSMLVHCDFITFDFDIGSSPMAHAVLLALSLREILTEIGLVGYPKTSGQSGLHVLVPMGEGVTFVTARALVDLLGRLLERRHGDNRDDGAPHQPARQSRLHRHWANGPLAHHRLAVFGARPRGRDCLDATRLGRGEPVARARAVFDVVGPPARRKARRSDAPHARSGSRCRAGREEARAVGECEVAMPMRARMPGRGAKREARVGSYEIWQK